MAYKVEITPLFRKNLRRYRSMRKQIQRHVGQVLDDPYRNTKRLGQIPGGLDLRGCRSIRVDPQLSYHLRRLRRVPPGTCVPLLLLRGVAG